MRHGLALSAIVAATTLGACGTSDRDARVDRVIAACEAHDGVAAFDDDIVICGDETSHQVRGG